MLVGREIALPLLFGSLSCLTVLGRSLTICVPIFDPPTQLVFLSLYSAYACTVSFASPNKCFVAAGLKAK